MIEIKFLFIHNIQFIWSLIGLYPLIPFCANGHAIPIEEFCKDQEQCPISNENQIALKSNCSHSSNRFCPHSISSSKVCMDTIDISLEDICYDYWNCPNSVNGPFFEQCYDR